MDTRSTRVRRLVSNLGTGVSIAVITAAILEMTLWFFLPYYESSTGQWKWDPHLGARIREGFHGANKLGHLDDPFTPKRRPGWSRALFIGDSFSYYGGLRGNYVAKLEEILESSPHPTEVYNLGFPAIGPRDYYLIYHHDARHLKPDLVVMGFFVGNDYANLPGHHATVVHGRLAYPPPVRLAKWANTPFYIGRFFDLLHRNWTIRQRTKRVKNTRTTREAWFLNVEKQRLGFSKIVPPDPRKRDGRRAHAHRYIKKIADEARQAGHRFLVAIYPDVYQVDRKLHQKLMDTFALEPDDYDLLLPQKTLKRFLSKEEIDFVDLTPVFQAHGRHKKLYGPHFDTHWNEAGRALAASVLAPEVVSRLR